MTTPAVRTRARTRPARAAREMPDALWTRADLVVTVVLLAAGVLLVVLAWFGASDTTDWDSQMSWTALAMIGVVVACAGVGGWLYRGFARVRVEARAVRRSVGRRIAARTAPAAGADDAVDRRRVTVAGMAHHHRADCLLVRGKPVVAADETLLKPCGVCA
ncbi:hypothetical protein [Sporichthya polymorpha]|uniref:hypothetical protein n=1 Tax=Sporichthya polymorpha TaxID=35751 RepID=UPI0003AADC36|nr:hypothetical protein [Sporichthya polymorpha]